MADSQNPKLYRVPNVIGTESLSSWLSRLALSQGCSIHEIRKFLKITTYDIDLFLATNPQHSLALASGLNPDEFSAIRRVFSQLHEINENGAAFLLRRDKQPLSRYCPLCLKTDPVPHFRIEWRFDPWRWCPIHSCLLNDRCPNCHRTIQTPFNMINAGSGQSGIANLSYCHSCGLSLLTGKPSIIDMEKVPAETRALLMNGRAFLASLYHGYFYIKGDNSQRALSELVQFHQNRPCMHTFLALCSNFSDRKEPHALTWLCNLMVEPQRIWNDYRYAQP